MFRDAMLILRQWWVADRIRCTPGHSQLLQLAVNDRVLVRDRLWAVIRRKEWLTDTSTQVHYELIEEDESNSISLVISFENAKPTQWDVRWQTEKGEEELFVEDIVPLQKTNSQRSSG
jgi:hypothetical protein